MSETIQIKKDTFYKGTIVVLAVLLIISLFTGGFGLGSAPSVTGTPSGNNPTGGTTANVQVILDNPNLFTDLGPANAKATVIELVDFKCGYCTLAAGLADWTAEYSSQYGDLIGIGKNLKELAKQGEIRLIIVPLNFLSSESTYATQALFCAERQDKEWEMHDAMFSVPQGYALSKENLKTLASQISGMDTNSFNSCLDNDETLAQAQQVMAKAQSAGFQISTPQFWVNGKQVQSSWTAIQAAINAA